MSSFSQFSLSNCMYRLSWDQLLYWYQMSNFIEHQIEPLKDRMNTTVSGDAEISIEDFRENHTYTKDGWVKNG